MHKTIRSLFLLLHTSFLQIQLQITIQQVFLMNFAVVINFVVMCFQVREVDVDHRFWQCPEWYNLTAELLADDLAWQDLDAPARETSCGHDNEPYKKTRFALDSASTATSWPSLSDN